MRLSPSALSAQLKKSFLPLYVLWGNEPFLIDDSARLLRETFENQHQGQYESFTMDTHSASWSTLMNQIAHRSLFSSKRMIDLRLNHLKLTAKETQALHSLLLESRDIGTHVFFIIQLGSLSRPQQQATWFIEADKRGAMIPHWAPNRSQFTQWVKDRLKQKAVTLPPPALNELVYRTEGNCLAAAQEIEVLSLLADTPNTSLFSYCQPQNQFSVFDWIETILRRDPERLIMIIDRLKQEGTALPLMVWGLAHIVQNLIACENVREEDKRISLLKKAGVTPPVQSLYLAWLNNFPFPPASLLPALSALDQHAKTGHFHACWQSIIAISLQLMYIKNMKN